MRTSGRSGWDNLIFVTPAAIFVAFFLWMSGSPLDAATELDRLVLNGVHGALALCQAVIAAVSRL